MKKYICSIFFLFQCIIVFSQPYFLTGYVTDETNQPIEFANVHLSSPDKIFQLGTTTNAEGAFRIEIPVNGIFDLTISFIGFVNFKQTIPIKKSIALGLISLEQSINELGEVVVTTTQKIIEKKEGKLIFNVQASPLKSGYDGIEVLERSPNVLMDENGNVTMRNEIATVLINGKISTLNGEDLSNYLSSIPSDEIKHIEIQAHLTANADAESSGGLINIILKKKPVGIDANIRSDFTIKGDAKFSAYSGLNFNYGAEKWNIYGAYNFERSTSATKNISSINYHISQNYLSENGTWENSRKRHSYRIGFVADAMKNHFFGIEGFATNSFNHVDNQNFVNISNNEIVLEKGKAILDGIIDNDLYTLTSNYEWIIDTMNSNLTLFADYAHQQIIGNTDVASTYERALYPNNTERNNTTALTKIYSIQTDLEKYFKHEFKLATGIKWSFTDRENELSSEVLTDNNWILNDRSNAFNYSEQVLAGYISLQKTFKKKYFAEVGLRVENTNLKRVDLTQFSDISQYYTDLFPSLYFSSDLPNNNTFSFNYAKRLRRPHFQFLNNYVIKVNDFRYELGNPDLRPEYVHGFEISFNQKKQIIVVYFDKVFEAINGIYFLENQISYYKKFNAGTQTQYGLSYNRFGKLYKWWFLKFTAEIFNRKFTEENGTDKFERATGHFFVTNNFKINSTTNIEISATYRSRFEDAYYVAFNRYNVNVMFQKTFLENRLKCRIYLTDIFNTLIYDNERPFTDFVSMHSHKPQTRTLRLWITYNFSNKNKFNQRTNKSKNEARERL